MERDTDFGRSGKRTTWGLSGDLITNNTSKTFTMQTGDLSDSDFKVFTVTFSIQAPAGANNGGYQALATVTFLTNGVPITRQITVGQAAEISGPTDAITVRAVDATPTIWTNPGQTYTVSCVIAPGTRTSLTRALLADTQGNAPGGTGTYQIVANQILNINVPQNAGVDGFYMAVALWGSTTSIIITEQTQGGDQIYVHQPLASGSGGFSTTQTTFGWFPVLPGASQISVSAGTGQTPAFTIVWTISG